MYDPEARGFGRPRPKHMKLRPRWYGVEVGENSNVTVRKASPSELERSDREQMHDMEYGSTRLDWNPSRSYTTL